jgi:hypothetical protein
MRTRYLLTFGNRSDREIAVWRWLALRLSYYLKSPRYISVTVRVTDVPGCAAIENGQIRNVSMSAWDFLKIL